MQKSFHVLPEVLSTGTKTVVSSLDCEAETEIATELGLAVEGKGSTRPVAGGFAIREGDIGVYEGVVEEDNVAVGEGWALGVEVTLGEGVAVEDCFTASDGLAVGSDVDEW